MTVSPGELLVPGETPQQMAGLGELEHAGDSDRIAFAVDKDGTRTDVKLLTTNHAVSVELRNIETGEVLWKTTAAEGDTERTHLGAAKLLSLSVEAGHELAVTALADNTEYSVQVTTAPVAIFQVEAPWWVNADWDGEPVVKAGALVNSASVHQYVFTPKWDDGDSRIEFALGGDPATEILWRMHPVDDAGGVWKAAQGGSGWDQPIEHGTQYVLEVRSLTPNTNYKLTAFPQEFA